MPDVPKDEAEIAAETGRRAKLLAAKLDALRQNLAVAGSSLTDTNECHTAAVLLSEAIAALRTLSEAAEQNVEGTRECRK